VKLSPFDVEAGADTLPPLLSYDPYTPLEHYIKLRELFGFSVTDSRYLPLLDSVLSHPFTSLSLPALTLKYWREWERGRGTPLPPFPFAPVKGSCAHQCQLALLWGAMGEKTGGVEWKEAAEALAQKWIPFLESGFLTLGSTEKEYEREEHQICADLMLQREVGEVKDPFLAFLASCSKGFSRTGVEKKSLVYSPFPPQVGAFSHRSISIPAFGPQGPLLSDASLCGASLVEKGWFQAMGNQEAWFHLQNREGEIGFSIQSRGVSMQAPLFWVFYIRAEECVIGSQRFRPQHLGRFQGEAREVILRSGIDQVIVQADHPMQAQLIPLAGQGCFWDASFLLAFQWPVLAGNFGFRFNSI
jgi:hypothetical protein